VLSNQAFIPIFQCRNRNIICNVIANRLPQSSSFPKILKGDVAISSCRVHQGGDCFFLLCKKTFFNTKTQRTQRGIFSKLGNDAIPDVFVSTKMAGRTTASIVLSNELLAQQLRAVETNPNPIDRPLHPYEPDVDWMPYDPSQ
jgi:hypothetical protein